MRTRLFPRASFFHVMMMLLIMTLAGNAFGYGGGGGDEKEDDAASNAAQASITPLTAEDIRGVFGSIGPGKTPGLDTVTVSILTTLFEGREISIRTLMGIRQMMLEAHQFQTGIARFEAIKNLILIQILDGAGQVSQVVLTFVPGVGWGTNAALGFTRAGADEIKKGSDWDKVGGAMLLDGTTSLITKGIPLGGMGDKALTKGAKGLCIAKGAISKTVKKGLIKRSKSRIKAGLVAKVLNKGVSDVTKAGVKATGVVEMTIDEAKEVHAWATAQKKQNKVNNLAAHVPAISTHHVISIPEVGPDGRAVALPADY